MAMCASWRDLIAFGLRLAILVIRPHVILVEQNARRALASADLLMLACARSMCLASHRRPPQAATRRCEDIERRRAGPVAQPFVSACMDDARPCSVIDPGRSHFESVQPTVALACPRPTVPGGLMNEDSNTGSSAIALAANATLLVVDTQVAFDDPRWGQRNNPKADANLAELVSRFSETGRPVVVVRHDSTNPDSLLHPSQPGHQLKDYVRDLTPDLLVSKAVNSSFHGSPDLHLWLRDHDIHQIVVAGMTTNHCCETTARVGGNLGYDVLFVIDATHHIRPDWARRHQAVG